MCSGQGSSALRIPAPWGSRGAQRSHNLPNPAVSFRGAGLDPRAQQSSPEMDGPPPPLYGRNTTPVSKALQVPLVGFPKGPWWSLSPPAQGSTPLSRVRLDPAWAGGGVCAWVRRSQVPSQDRAPSPSSPPLLLSGWQVSSCLPNCHASSETHPSP